MKRIIKYCLRCSGTGILARRGESKPVVFVTCTRCKGHKGKTELVDAQ